MLLGIKLEALLYWFENACVAAANADALNAMAELFERGDYIDVRDFSWNTTSRRALSIFTFEPAMRTGVIKRRP